MDELLRLEQVEYGYLKNGVNTRVIKNACGVFYKAGVHVITGRSDEERAVLLSLMAGLELPCGGRIFFKGRDIGSIDRDAWRKRDVGMVLQAYKLVSHLTALENAALRMESLGIPAAERKKTAVRLLEKAGFDISKCGRRASRLSPSEQQRVALAGAVGHAPQLLLIEADGWSADPELEHALMGLLADAARLDGACAVIASNSGGPANWADEVWGVKDGVLLPLKTRD
jgi:putative ABC transport system ATP-binding protein